jgi:hypothetical protein
LGFAEANRRSLGDVAAHQAAIEQAQEVFDRNKRKTSNEQVSHQQVATQQTPHLPEQGSR